VGGNTNGNVTMALTGARQRDRVCESHQAKGMAMMSRQIVVTAAKRKVSKMASMALWLSIV
jgi:hypothetical protein